MLGNRFLQFRLKHLKSNRYFYAHRPNSIHFQSRKTTKKILRSRSAFAEEKEEDEADSSNSNSRFEGTIELFNNIEYYACHDVVENLWYSSSDPTRTLLHALLQCAVGFHHLFNQNHKGAMMELGEVVCKLRKLDLIGGPFHQFEREISDVLEFIYQTRG
ncbi:hypothetical protein V2J09_018325 [Rumex salicifolius]